MALTYSSFLVSFPEFSKAPQTLVEAKLADAYAMLSETAFGDLYDTAAGYYAAHLLATSTYGQQMRLVNKEGSTPYSEFYHTELLPRVARRGGLI